jgi:ComF family protein
MSCRVPFLEALFPEVCMICRRLLYEQEQHICLYCLHRMPRTDFFKRKENELFLRLANRIPLQSAQSLFYFHKKNNSQHLVHAIKYFPQATRAYWFGQLMGKVWQEQLDWMPDALVPVPLHSKRKQQRGYNQSLALAEGFASMVEVPVYDDALCRRTYKVSQTQKGKDGRWEDMQGTYEANPKIDLSEKKVLLLDDIITTGSTIEACGQLLTTMDIAELHVYSLSVAVGL